jgi:glyoxylase-like metal-dependent hydrolase (beta-lactamase superfamily II)
MRVHAETKPLRGPLPGGAEGATVAVEPLSGGEVHFPAASFEAPGGRFESLKVTGLFTSRARGWWWVPCPAFLITHPSVGPVLVDTSLHPSIASKPAENFGRLAVAYAHPRVEPGEDLPAQLRRRGIDPKAVRYVVMTHLHMDHASGMSEFPNSTFVLSDAEWEAATTGARPLLRGYRPKQYDYVFDYRTLDYSGPGIESYSSFGRTFDLFGDGSVRLAFTPGHSAGHQCVIARLAQRDFVIAGDVVYNMRQLDGGPEPAAPFDRHNWKRSLQELQLFRRDYPDAIIVPSHDAELWRTLDERYG